MGKHRTLRSSSNGLAHDEIIKKREKVLLVVLAAMEGEGVHVTLEEVNSKRRQHHKAVARSMVSYILYAHYRMGPTAIGNALGINHSTTIYQRRGFENKAQTIAWIGRAYIAACKALRLNPLKWLKPRTEDKPIVRVYEDEVTARKMKKQSQKRGVDIETEVMDKEFKTLDYTPEERARIKLLMKYPGGVPKTELESFHRRFGTEL